MESLFRRSLDMGLPGSGVLTQEQPAAHVEHKPRRNNHDRRFQSVVMRPIEIHLENNGGAKTRDNRGNCAQIKFLHLTRCANASEKRCKRGDHKHCLKPLAQKNASRLQCGREVVHPTRLIAISFGLMIKPRDYRT